MTNLPGLVDDDHGRVGFLVLQVRRDQADDGAERDDADDAVEGGEQRWHLVADLAFVAMKGTRGGGFAFKAKFLRAKELRAGEGGDNFAGKRDAMFGNRDDCYFHDGVGGVVVFG